MYFGGNNHGCQECSKTIAFYTQADRLITWHSLDCSCRLNGRGIIVMARRGVGLGYACLTVGIWDFHVCVCVHARTDCGRCASVRVCNLRRRLNSVVYFTHSASYIASSKAILSIASIKTDNQTVLKIFGGVVANSLCQLLKRKETFVQS